MRNIICIIATRGVHNEDSERLGRYLTSSELLNFYSVVHLAESPTIGIFA